MAVSDRDRNRFAVQARDLASIETDELPAPDVLARVVAEIDVDRAARGIPPLRVEEHPEEELYRRARALGLRRRRR